MLNTSGLFLITEDNRLLICHPTNAPMNRWSIPKGLQEEGESLLSTAFRETEEETGLSSEVIMNFSINYESLKPVLYVNKKKRLHAYIFQVKNEITSIPVTCKSMIDNTDVPENDKVEWVDLNSAFLILHPAQQKMLWNSSLSLNLVED